MSVADRLPNATPENQMISISTVIDVIGMVDTSTTLSWDLSSGTLHSGILGNSEVAGALIYRDSLMTNGGHLMMNKNFNFDSSNKQRGANNLETSKVISYDSIEGSHLSADEMISMDIAGNYTPMSGVASCVFASSSGSAFPAFCNTVTAKSTLVNINSAQISTGASARMASDSGSVPAGLSYHIDLTPNPVSGLAYAMGTARTEFTLSSMEARDGGVDTWNKTAATNTYKDSSEVSGSIIHFSKAFDYGSGLNP
ncbi:MAG TPA: hypothetical protein VN372_11365 [Methanospirillum sp.]|nr:hypothetical protein [Methanospirillum sp.]